VANKTETLLQQRQQTLWGLLRPWRILTPKKPLSSTQENVAFLITVPASPFKTYSPAQNINKVKVPHVPIALTAIEAANILRFETTDF
jgi:hypothetical protein